VELVKLKDQIKDHFNQNDLKELCFNLGLDFEDLPGETRKDKARELVIYCQQHGLLMSLVNQCQKLRPHLSWQDILTGTPATTQPQQRQLEAARAEIKDLLILFERAAFRPDDGNNGGDPTAAFNAIYETRLALQTRGASLIADPDSANQFREIQGLLLKLEGAVMQKYPQVVELAVKWRGKPTHTQERLADIRATLGDSDYANAAAFIRAEAVDVYFAAESIRQKLRALNSQLPGQ
jgi:hypothetical protein